MKKITILLTLMLIVSIAMAQFAKKGTALQQKEAYVFTE